MIQPLVTCVMPTTDLAFATAENRMTRLGAHRQGGSSFGEMGLGRVELPTSRLSGVRSNHLSYRPLQNRTG